MAMTVLLCFQGDEKCGWEEKNRLSEKQIRNADNRANEEVVANEQRKSPALGYFI